jgi:hypothetical protein
VKLSEAMRLGSMLRPQVSGGFMDQGSCALGAISDAVGIAAVAGDRPYVNYCALRKALPMLDSVVATPECDGVRQRELYEAIYVLNDIHQWTREQIADWVETIEQQQAEKSPTAVEAQQG